MRSLSCRFGFHDLFVAPTDWTAGVSMATCRRCGHRKQLTGLALVEFVRTCPARQVSVAAALPTGVGDELQSAWAEVRRLQDALANRSDALEIAAPPAADGRGGAISWITSPPVDLRDHHLMALRFLAARSHTMDVLENDNDIAAAVVFEQLVNGGWVRKLKLVGSDGNTYGLTDKGREALR